MELFISKCKNGHYFINKEKCALCGEGTMESVPYRDGDCIDCGQLCPGHAYGCNEPLPLRPEDFKINH